MRTAKSAIRFAPFNLLYAISVLKLRHFSGKKILRCFILLRVCANFAAYLFERDSLVLGKKQIEDFLYSEPQSFIVLGNKMGYEFFATNIKLKIKTEG